MSGVRVADLALALRIPESMRGQGAALERVSAGTFVPGVLAAMERRLAGRLGRAAVVHVQDLRMKLRTRAGELSDPDLADRLAADLARYIVETGRRPTARRPASVFDAPVQIFQSETEFRAVRVIAAARRQKGPHRAREDVAALWAEDARRPEAEQAELLEICHRLGGLRDLATALPLADLRAARRRLKTRLASPVARALAEIAAQRLAEAAARRPAPDLDAAASAGEPRDPGADPPETAATDKPPAAGADTAADPAKHADSAPSPPADPRRCTRPDRPEPPAPARAPAPAPQTAPAPPDRAAADSSAPAAARPAPEAAGLAVTCGWCGLFYLLNLSLRTGLPERLWRIGASEGDVLAAALRRIAGPEVAGPEVLSPEFPGPPLPVPAPARWARDELDTWLAAVLAEADPTGPAAARLPAVDARLREDADWDLAARIGAFHLVLAEHRLERTLDRNAIRERFALPGRIVLDDDLVSVIQPAEAIDIEIRKAGLDADPGWLPWLERRLVFVFTDPETA